MKSSLLLQPAYFAPIVQYAAIVQHDEIVFENFDNFQKQTCRNRSFIYGANGKLLLNIPVINQKGIKSLTKDVKISYAENWHQLHFKSLVSAYRNSPYFEYYVDDIAPIFEQKHTYLKDLHELSHDFMMDALQEEIPFSYSLKYFKMSENSLDGRNLINTKEKLSINFPEYVQMFDDKHGFIPNLSILDLLFMEGPNTNIYLNSIKFK